MDAQRFLAEFGHIVGAPGGIRWIKETINILAVQGKLVPQSSSEEPVLALIERVAASKREFINEGKIKRESNRSNNRIQNAPLRGWDTVFLGDIAWPQAGFAFKANLFNQSGNGLPLIRVRDVGDNNPQTYFSGSYRDEFLVEEGDWLVAMDGDFRICIWTGPTALLNQRVSRLIFYSNEINARYVSLALQFELRKLQGVKAYTTVDHLSGKQIADSLIPLPPAEEQARIVAKVDELMALCDNLEIQQRQLRNLQNKLRQSTLQALAASTSSHELQTAWISLADNFGQLFYMPNDLLDLRQCIKQLALRGFLTNRDVGEEISPDLKNSVVTSSQPVIEKHMDWEIPNQWMWVKTVWLGEARLGKMLDASKNKGELLPYLRNINVRWRKFELTDVLTMRVEPHELLKISVRQGDLVICEGGEPGRAAIWKEPHDFVIQKALHRFRCGKDVLSEYMLLCLEHDYFSGRLSRYYTGATIKHLTGRSLSEYAIPLPPIAEQYRIVKRVEELMLICDRFESQLSWALTIADRLAASAVASVTGITTESEEKQLLKTPKTELIAKLRLANNPDIKAQAPLAAILARHQSEMSVGDLWQRYGGEIDAFYAQLKQEVGKGWIAEPAIAEMRETEAG